MQNSLKLIEAVTRTPVLVLGAGNIMRADDAAGCIIAEQVAERFPRSVIDGGMVPENFVGPIRHARPGAVILVDAADFGANPGELYIAHESEVAGDMFGTHGAPLGLFMRALNEELGCDVILVAIQIESMDLDGEMTEPVKAAVDTVVAALGELLERTTTAS
ncbi:hydrogenase maturation protease [bacterium]|nr:hydrogenase maturation protease [bacterium]